ncbi:MAG: SMI1/KNR4 family protein [Saprospiraceae bacterium]|nr:SMI1/KNR4 family protein [Saprospiraceae bacterium]
MNSYQIKTIKNKLARLRDLDECYIIEGAKEHKYHWYPCLSEKEISHYEEKLGIQLPSDYRNFIKYIGNGGAGPQQGVLPLAEWPNLRIQEAFEGEWQILLEQYEQDLKKDRALLLKYHSTDLPNRIPLADLDRMSTLSLFRLCDKYNIPLGVHEGEEYVFYPDYCEKGELNDYAQQISWPSQRLKGYLPVISAGDAGNGVLIVNGYNYGELFWEGLDGNFKNTRKCFLELYMNWLDNNLANFEHINLLLRTSLPVDAILQAQLYYTQQKYTIKHVVASIIGVLIPEGLDTDLELEWLQKQVDRWRLEQKESTKTSDSSTSNTKESDKKEEEKAKTEAGRAQDDTPPQDDDEGRGGLNPKGFFDFVKKIFD